MAHAAVAAVAAVTAAVAAAAATSSAAGPCVQLQLCQRLSGSAPLYNRDRMHLEGEEKKA